MLPDSVDSRFDPRFQRGYDPALHEAPAEAPAAGPHRDEAPEPVGARDEAAHLQQEDPDEPPTATRRDPFSRVLPILAALCFAATAWLSWRYIEVSATQWSRPSVSDDEWIISVAIALVPGLVGAGFVALIAWLGVRSLQARA